MPVCTITWPGNDRSSWLAQTHTTKISSSEEWNFYRYPDEDDWDKPSKLHEQLNWIVAAGYDVADCFWMQAGHAIYGGYKGHSAPQTGLSWERAIEIATSAVES